MLRRPDGQQLVLKLAGRTHVTIGRRPESDLSLPWDPRVSRLHAELEMVGNDWVVSDDGLSTNGTWLGSERLVRRHRLLDGDEVRVGGTVIAFCAPLELVSATAVADDPAAALEISPAQRRVLVALCKPFLQEGTPATPTNAQLAAELNLAVDSVKTHLRALFALFELDEVPTGQKRDVLVDRAVRIGLVSAREPGAADQPADGLEETAQAP